MINKFFKILTLTLFLIGILYSIAGQTYQKQSISSVQIAQGTTSKLLRQNAIKKPICISLTTENESEEEEENTKKGKKLFQHFFVKKPVKAFFLNVDYAINAYAYSLKFSNKFLYILFKALRI